jgi:hypothetical protein
VTSKLLPGAAVAVALAGLAAVACNKDGHAASQGSDTVASPSSQANCGHTACGSNFFVDAVTPADCAPGAKCTVDVKLVATGEFHINDEYPYKFRADDAPGVEYLGADAAGKNTFSRDAKDWKKTDEKSGVMTLAFRASDKGQKTVGGTFKLSVCSAQNCQLEQQPVKATVAIR